MKRIIRAVAVLATAFGVLLTAEPAWAQAYDYTNPSSTSCANSGGPANGAASTVPIRHPEISGNVLGWVDLRWSTGCQTNWSRVRINSGAAYAVPSLGILTWAVRPGDGASTQGHDGDPGPYYGSSAFSAQLNGSGGQVVCAYGKLAYRSINGPIGWAQAGYCF